MFWFFDHWTPTGLYVIRQTRAWNVKPSLQNLLFVSGIVHDLRGYCWKKEFKVPDFTCAITEGQAFCLRGSQAVPSPSRSIFSTEIRNWCPLRRRTPYTIQRGVGIFFVGACSTKNWVLIRAKHCSWTLWSLGFGCPMGRGKLFRTLITPTMTLLKFASFLFWLLRGQINNQEYLLLSRYKSRLRWREVVKILKKFVG